MRRLQWQTWPATAAAASVYLHWLHWRCLRAAAFCWLAMSSLLTATSCRCRSSFHLTSPLHVITSYISSSITLVMTKGQCFPQHRSADIPETLTQSHVFFFLLFSVCSLIGNFSESWISAYNIFMICFVIQKFQRTCKSVHFHLRRLLYVQWT